jgi:hypothetical protein
MSDIDEAVNRFLGWRLPETFNPDGGISFVRNPAYPMPTGTNLLDCNQARAMLEYVLAIGQGSAVIEEIAAERRRQVEEEGWSESHDDLHNDGELAAAAGCYALHASGRDDSILRFDEDGTSRRVPRGWRWHWKWWKPKDRRRDLIRAAALIVAEIERLDRTEG